MEALLVQVVILGATWLIPRLAQLPPTQIEVNDPSVFVSGSQGPTDQAEHQHVGEIFSKVSWPDSQRGVGGHQITHNPSASFITSDNICHKKLTGVGVGSVWKLGHFRWRRYKPNKPNTNRVREGLLKRCCRSISISAERR